ncbi:MAG: glycosyltransferase, partial [Betaproteobacteria bacterium]
SSVVLLSGVHLCHNPRVLKEATALAEAGLAVEVLGAWFDSSLKAQDQAMLAGLPFRFTPVLDLAVPGTAGALQQLAIRMCAKAGQVAYAATDVPNRWQLGYAVGALSRAAGRRNADLFIAHSEAALLVAQRLLASGRRVGVDMEDWFSEDLLPEARRHRPTGWLHEMEGRLLTRGAHTTCPSQAMSLALASAYGCAPPAVVYNAFPFADRDKVDGRRLDRPARTIPSIHWYSQMVGRGRGLEDLLAALPYLEHDAEIHLRGKPVHGFDEWLAARVPPEWRSRVHVHGIVTSDTLLSRIAEHDIGFAGEMNFAASRELTVTNKILHYLLAGLAVVASDTAGQREVSSRAQGAVLLYPSGDEQALAVQLNRLLSSPALLQASKSFALQAARQTFCWEEQSKVLLASVTRAIGAP